MEVRPQQQHGIPDLDRQLLLLLQYTLRSICTESSQWVYAVFWRIMPRNYPQPKWENEGGFLDRSKGNKRNWILTWEDGFCNFAACAKASIKSGDEGSSEPSLPQLFFKMAHEVYSYGEGLMGKVASDSSHKWIFKDPADQDSSLVSPWHGSLDPHPRTWESQFKAGIQTIAIVSVQEGILQLGAVDKVFEDLNLVILLQRKFTYLQSIPGVLRSINHSGIRPRLPLIPNQHSHLQQQQHHQLNYGMLDDSFIGLNEHQRMNLVARTHPPSSTTSFNQQFQDNNLSSAAAAAADHIFPESNQLPNGLKRSFSDRDDHHQTSVNAALDWYHSTNGRNIPERPPLSKSLNTGNSPPGVVPHQLQPSMSSLEALLSKLPSIASSTENANPNADAGAPPLSRSLSMPGQLKLNVEDKGGKREAEEGRNGSCKSGSTGSTSSDVVSKGNGSKDNLIMSYMEAFDNVNDYGMQCDEALAYNRFLSEIMN